MKSKGKTLLLALLGLACALVWHGCSSTQVLHNPAEARHADKIYQLSVKGKGTLHLADGRRVAGWKIRVQADSTAWLTDRTYQPRSVATAPIRRLGLVDHGQAAAGSRERVIFSKPRHRGNHIQKNGGDTWRKKPCFAPRLFC